MSDNNQLPIENDDDAALHMLAGATFSPDTTVTLPSGKVISGDEMQAFTSLFLAGERPPIVRARLYLAPDYDATNPLSPANDRWTGNPWLDRQILVGRALQAAVALNGAEKTAQQIMRRPRKKPSLLARIARRFKRQ